MSKVDYSWRIGINSPNWRGGKITKNCLFCKGFFLVFPSHFSKNFCSRKCTDRFKSKNYFGEKHFNWKGEDVGYFGLHTWLKKVLGKPKVCSNESCFYPRFNERGKWMEKPKRYEWANISGKYLRDVKDYFQLCPSCHRKYDLELINISV